MKVTADQIQRAYYDKDTNFMLLLIATLLMEIREKQNDND